MLKLKDIMRSRKDRKKFVTEIDATIQHLADLLKEFPEYDRISISVNSDGTNWGDISDDNFIISREHVRGYHPSINVTVLQNADSLAQEAERVSA